MQQDRIETIQPLIIADSTGKIYYKSQPKQSEVHWAIRNRYKTGIDKYFFSGSAGSGKSILMRWEAHNQCIHNAGIRILLLRSSFPELERTHITQVSTDLDGSIIKYNQNKKVVQYFNGSVLEFGYGERKDDISQYLSAEYDIIMIDELTTIPFEFTLILMSRMRTRKKGFMPFLLTASNPGGIAHRYVKSYFIDKDFDEEFPELSSQYQPEKILFIPATVYDNPALLDNDPYYIDRLKALPPLERKRFLEGSWDLFESMFFSTYSKSVHVIKKFDIPKTWNKIAGMDYGNVSCAYIITQDPQSKIFYVTDEWVEKNKSATEKARSYKMFLRDRGYMDILTIGDTNMFAKLKEFGGDFKPSVDYFRAEGLKFKMISKKSEDTRKFRRYCNDYIKDLLNWSKDDNGLYIVRPKVYFFENCKYLTKTIPELNIDKNDDRDYDRYQDNTHGVDAFKMGLISFRNNSNRVSGEQLNYLRQYLNKVKESVKL